MKLQHIIFLFCVSMASLQTSFAFAQTTPPLARKVLAIYQKNPKAVDELFQTEIHRHLEAILNFLGLEVEYHEVNTGILPENLKEQGFRGVISWFYDSSAVADSGTYCRWITRQMNQGVRWIPLQFPGLLKKGTTSVNTDCQAAFKTLGVEYRGEFTHDDLYLDIVHKDPSLVEFERPLSLTENLYYVLLHPVDPKKIDASLVMRRTDIEDSDSPLVFTSPHGGLAYAGYITYENSELGKIKFRLNPFRFFTKALGLENLPRPDVSTINGRRAFMTHIDGDGIFNVSQIDRTSYSGEIIAGLIQKYATLPFSVSLITGYFDTPEYNSARIDTLYRRLFTAQNVEAAAHGYAHPLIWKTGTYALKVPNYRYNDKFEVEGAINKMRKLFDRLGIQKPVGIYFWTGNCLPSEQQTAYAAQAGALNINGGDSTFYNARDSYAFLSPLGLLRGKTRQIYAAFANENTYTNLWQSRYYGFRDSIQSLQNTETPLRIKPIDVYYHYYSGEKQASYAALLSIYDWASAQKINPIFITQYARMVEDFFATDFHAVDGGWLVENHGKLRTVRFDDTTSNIDLAKSSGVIGFSHFQGSLYVHLDESTRHTLILTAAVQETPYIEEASFQISRFKAQNGMLNFAKKGWLKSEAVFAGLKPGKPYEINEGNVMTQARADDNGRLSWAFKTLEGSGLETNVSLRESF
jgi:hypothetical protein